MSTWLSDNEKYALIALDVRVRQRIPLQQFAPGYWASTDIRLRGSAALARMARHNPNRGTCAQHPYSPVQNGVLNPSGARHAKSSSLSDRCGASISALLLSSTFTPDEPPMALTGGGKDGEWDVLQQSSVGLTAASLVRRFPSVKASEVEQAARFGALHEQLIASPPPGGAWRFVRALTVFVEGRQTRELVDRLHQFCRCIDGLILSEPGKGSKQFKSRTELFIGPGHHNLMGQIYSIRNDIEHLHEHKYLEVFDRPTRLDLAEKEAIAEDIARKALGHILSTPTLWPHFGNSVNLASFWQRDATDRQSLWGAGMIDPADALSNYDPDAISDGELGKRP